MAINYFLGWGIADLERELRVAQEDLAAGKAPTGAGSGDANVQSQVEQNAMSRIKLLLQALNKLDPEKYPADDVTAITQTRIAFS